MSPGPEEGGRDEKTGWGGTAGRWKVSP